MSFAFFIYLFFVSFALYIPKSTMGHSFGAIYKYIEIVLGSCFFFLYFSFSSLFIFNSILPRSVARYFSLWLTPCRFSSFFSTRVSELSGEGKLRSEIYHFEVEKNTTFRSFFNIFLVLFFILLSDIFCFFLEKSVRYSFRSFNHWQR